LWFATGGLKKIGDRIAVKRKFADDYVGRPIMLRIVISLFTSVSLNHETSAHLSFCLPAFYDIF